VLPQALIKEGSGFSLLGVPAITFLHGCSSLPATQRLGLWHACATCAWLCPLGICTSIPLLVSIQQVCIQQKCIQQICTSIPLLVPIQQICIQQKCIQQICSAEMYSADMYKHPLLVPIQQDIMGATGKQPPSGHLSAAETAAMVNTFKSGVRHAGWLHKLVGKTPQDTSWRKYWVRGRAGQGCAASTAVCMTLPPGCVAALLLEEPHAVCGTYSRRSVAASHSERRDSLF